MQLIVYFGQSTRNFSRSDIFFLELGIYFSFLHSTSTIMPKCNQCGKDLEMDRGFRDHLRDNTGLKPYKCRLCGLAFSRREVLKRHMTVHSGLKQYKCHVCNTNIAVQSTLLDHLKRHTKERPFYCGHCKKTLMCATYTMKKSLHARSALKVSVLEKCSSATCCHTMGLNHYAVVFAKRRLISVKSCLFTC